MSTVERFPHPALFAAMATWLTLIVLAPLGAAGGWSLAPWLYFAFDFVCHQLPERSFFLADHQLAVCHRCFGLYLGGLVGLLALPWLPGFRAWLATEPRRMLWCFLPLAIDVALPMNTWWSRFATGIVAALPVALLLWLAAEQILRAPGSSIERTTDTPTRLQVASGKGER
jgi:uncharacterized membrane protein